MSQKPAKARLGVFKLASCDGCQLSLLDCEDELLALAETVEIAYFLEAVRRPLEGEFDLVLIEGSVSTPEQVEYIRDVRRRARYLVTIGACATAGGIQALRNFADVQEYLQVVYARPDYIRSLARSTAIADHVPVDFELRGCPIAKQQLLEVISAFLVGRRPHVPRHSTCIECKRAGTVCVMVARGIPCLGPVTHAGCGALCPGYHRGCYGCYGPAQDAQVAALAGQLVKLGMSPADIERSLHTFNAWAPEFRRVTARGPALPVVSAGTTA
ncbi:MAG: oxidoreductase [Gemmataceae bacterium]